MDPVTNTLLPGSRNNSHSSLENKAVFFDRIKSYFPSSYAIWGNSLTVVNQYPYWVPTLLMTALIGFQMILMPEKDLLLCVQTSIKISICAVLILLGTEDYFNQRPSVSSSESLIHERSLFASETEPSYEVS